MWNTGFLGHMEIPEDGINGRGGGGMDEEAQWKQVDEYMSLGGFFDTVSVVDIEHTMSEFVGKDYKFVVNTCKWVIDTKKRGNNEL